MTIGAWHPEYILPSVPVAHRASRTTGRKPVQINGNMGLIVRSHERRTSISPGGTRFVRYALCAAAVPLENETRQRLKSFVRHVDALFQLSDLIAVIRSGANAGGWSDSGRKGPRRHQQIILNSLQNLGKFRSAFGGRNATQMGIQFIDGSISNDAQIGLGTRRASPNAFTGSPVFV